MHHWYFHNNINLKNYLAGGRGHVHACMCVKDLEEYELNVENNQFAVFMLLHFHLLMHLLNPQCHFVVCFCSKFDAVWTLMTNISILFPFPPGASIPFHLANLYNPLYFRVRQVTEVMSTEQPCDVAYEFGDGLFDPQNFAKGFPKPGRLTYRLVKEMPF